MISPAECQAHAVDQTHRNGIAGSRERHHVSSFPLRSQTNGDLYLATTNFASQVLDRDTLSHQSIAVEGRTGKSGQFSDSWPGPCLGRGEPLVGSDEENAVVFL